MQTRRLETLRKGRIELVSPSRWLADKVEERVPGTKVMVIPRGIDLDVFQPREEGREAESAGRMLLAVDHIGDIRSTCFVRGCILSSRRLFS